MLETIITYLCSGGLGALITWLITWKGKKQKADAEGILANFDTVKQLNDYVELKVADKKIQADLYLEKIRNLENQIIEVEKKIRLEAQQEVLKYMKQLTSLSVVIKELKVQLSDAITELCYVSGCKKRIRRDPLKKLKESANDSYSETGVGDTE